MLRVGGVIPDSQIYGPGTRYTIWVQGCSIRCKGCWNKEYWFDKAGELMTIQSLSQEINSLFKSRQIEGVTILGGEPLDQAASLKKFLIVLKNHSIPVLLYTGYESEEIKQNKIKQDCVNLADVVILGRYEEINRSIYLRWRGSSNQKILINNPEFDWMQNPEEQNEVEIHLEEDGTITILGYPEMEFFREMELFE